MRQFLAVLPLCMGLSSFKAQDSLKCRTIITHSSLVGIGTGSLVALQSVWYQPYQNDGFHWFNDADNWMQMDKLGHGFTAYAMSKSINELHQWSSGKKKPWVGVSYAFTYLTALEVMDGFSAGWGFSWPDVAANSFGCGLYITQEALWQRQIIHPKFSFRQSPYAKYRPDVLGSGTAEQLLKDYNGQTYWWSLPIKHVLPLPKAWSFLCFSVGYGCDAKLVGDQNTWQGFTARRQVYLSLDVDCSNLFPKHPKLNKVISALNYLKFPFPALEFSSDKTRFHWLGY